MKREWRKYEKNIYLPGKKPEVISIPAFKFFTIDGRGNPNHSFFGDYISVLYALAYGVKMSAKKEPSLMNYNNYTVYPLEGVWDISEEAIKKAPGSLDKDELVFTLMIRQPDFVTQTFAEKIMDMTQHKKTHPLLSKVSFITLAEGRCVQMLHTGSYEAEPESFNVMEEFCRTQGLKRISKTHREIYLSDARKTPPEKLKTVLRFSLHE